MIGYSQWLQWFLQDAFSGLVLGGIVLGVFVIGLVYRLVARVIGKE